MSQQIQITGGAKVRNLQDVIIGTSGVLSSVAFDVSNGVPRLDVNGKILVSQLPNSVMEYKGTWNAATNTPTLANGTGNQGDVYLCNVAGTVNFGAGAIAFVVGDQVIYSGSIWQRASGATGTVTSVAITESGDSLNITGSPITTSGTINIGFNGTNLQYVNGAGNLTTFPILTGYVPYTGATQDVDLGAFKLNAQSLHIKGTAGNGHLGLKHQSASATASANEVSLFADSLGDLSWQNGNLYLSKFITSGNTAARSYTFPNANGTVALTSDLANYVDLTTAQTIGGTKTFSDASKNNGGIFLQNASSSSLAGYMNIGGLTNGVKFTSGGGVSNSFTLPSATGYTFTFPNATGTIALTSDLTGYITAVTATSPLSSSGGTTPNITIAQATTSANGYLSSTDWNTFNNKQATITLTTTGTSGAATLIGATLNIPNYAPDLSGYVTLAGSQTITGAKTFSTYSKFDGGVILKNNVSASLAGYVGLSAYSASGNKGINIDFDTYSASFYFSGTLPYQYTFPAASGTIALVGGSGVGTVTSVAALTIGTSGTDLSSSVANSTTTPVITLNVPTASATNRGALSSADWTTFNNKQSALTNPVTGTGTTNYLPKFTGASTIGNSIISEGSNLINVNGDITIPVYYAVKFGGSSATAYIGDFNADGSIQFATSSSTKMRLNSSGNLGLGVTPSAWSTSFGIKVIDVGSKGTFYASDNDANVSFNQYFDGTNAVYKTTGTASRFALTGNEFTWRTAPSGTAGNAITFTQAMTLFSTGNLAIATVTDSGYKLDVNGTGRFSGNVLIGTSSLSNPVGFGNVLNIVASDAALVISNTGGTAKNWSIGALQSGSLSVWDGTTLRMDIASTGAATFSSSVTAGSNTTIVSSDGTYGGGYGSIGFGGNSNGYNRVFGGVGTGDGLFLASATGKAIYFRPNGGTADLMTITSGGNVLIGTTTDNGQKLQVQGNSTVWWNNDVFVGMQYIDGSEYRNGFLFSSDNRSTGIIAKAATGSTPYIWFGTGITPTERMRITSAGITQLKPATGDLALEVFYGATSTGAMIGDASNFIIGGQTSKGLVFCTNNLGQEKMRITTGGNVLIGTTSDNGYILDVLASKDVRFKGATNYMTLVLDNSSTTGGGGIYFKNNGTIGGGIGNSGWWFGDTSNDLLLVATTSKNIRFHTNDSTTEKMRLTSGGALCLGVTSAYGTNLLNVNGGIYATSSIAAVVAADIDMLAFVNTGATYSKACVVASMTATGGTGSYFFYGQQSTSTAAIKIFSNGNIQNTNNSYGAISDARLKENIKDATPKLDDLMKVKVRNYNLKGESNKQLGVISQELEAIFPNMIEESTNMGENMKIKGVKYSVFVPMLIKAVQEQQQQINELKQLINK